MIMQKYTGELTNYPFTIRTITSHKKGESENKRIFCEDIFTFDIETTSFFYGDDNIPFIYHTGEDPDYWNEVNAGGIPYIWQFGVNGTYYYGREFEDFYRLLDDFPENMKVRIFIHNLSFEWAWCDGLTWEKVFARTPHKPMKASCKEFPNIEFLCTLTLENMSLDIDQLVEGVYRDRMDRAVFHRKFVQFGCVLYIMALLVEFLIGIDVYISMIKENVLVNILIHLILIGNTYFLLNGEKYYNENVGAE